VYILCLTLLPGAESNNKREVSVLLRLKAWRKDGFSSGFRTHWLVFLRFVWVVFPRWEAQGDCTDHKPVSISVEQMVRVPVGPMQQQHPNSQCAPRQYSWK
jgi:hypothetical protein